MTDTKKKITEKQLAARLENLKKGREKRMANVTKKKEETEYEYDLGSQDASDSSSSDGDFVISRQKVVNKKNGPKPRRKEEIEIPTYASRNEFEDLKNMVRDLAVMQKKNNKAMKKQQPSKLVLIPPQQQQAAPVHTFYDSTAERLKKSLGM